MEQFVFRVVSNDPDYDNMENVIEMVESEFGDMSYDKMERAVDYLIDLGLIPSGKSEVYGTITISDTVINVEISNLVE